MCQLNSAVVVLLRLCCRCEAGQPEEGDSDHRDGSVSYNFPSEHSHTVHYCCSLSPVLTAAAWEWLAKQWDNVQNGFHHTEPMLNKLPYHVPHWTILWLNCHFIASFQSCFLCFSDCKQSSAVTGVMCLCVVVVSPGLFPLIGKSLLFWALMPASHSMLQQNLQLPTKQYASSHPTPFTSFLSDWEDWRHASVYHSSKALCAVR